MSNAGQPLALNAFPVATLEPTDVFVIARGINTYSTNPALNRAYIAAGDTLLRGQALYVKSDGTYGLAIGNDAAKCRVVGFAHADYAIGDPVFVDVTLTTPQSSTVAGTIYYLSATTAGAITSTRPGSGFYNVQVGVGNSSTQLAIILGTIPTAVE